MNMENLSTIKDALGSNKFNIFVKRSSSVSPIGFGKRRGAALANHFEESEGQAPERVYVQQNNEAHLIFQADWFRIRDFA
jgi:hypothetical protein